jgi:hypothetical protein
MFVRLRAKVCAGLAVNRDVTGRDQFVAMPARADSGSGKKAIETHGVINEALKPSKVKLNLDSLGGDFLNGFRGSIAAMQATRVSGRYRRKNAGGLTPYRVTSVK